MQIDSQQQQVIFARFNGDEGFRKRALDDPNKAVKEEFGVDLPFPMRVVSEPDGYRIEPVAGTNDDLTDDQLEMVSGGKGESASPVSPASGANKITVGGGVVATGAGNFKR